MEKKRILVADDEQDICELIEQALSREGFEVVCVNDGKQAKEKIFSEQFDLAILDVSMPAIDGYHLTYTITTEMNGPVPQIIILTSRDAKLDKDMGIKSGAKLHISKPFDIKDLVTKVKELLT